MTREEFEQQSGEEVEETLDQDAADQEIEEVQEEEFDDVTVDDDLDEDDLDIDLPEEQKTAFAKRLEREQKKIREAAEQELKEQYEAQYSKHKAVVDMLGGDVEQVEKMIRENQIAAEAQRQAQILANQYGWDDETMNQYMQQQIKDRQKDQELAELKVQMKINELKDNPDYLGISNMKKDIQVMINRSNGVLTVEQAYWALGGRSRAEQLRREAEQRQIAKRSKPRRTVQSDSPTSHAGEKPLSEENERLRRRMGLSVSEARALLKDSPSNLEEFRRQKKG